MSDKRGKLAKSLDIIIIITGYVLAVNGILSQDALLAFIWGQVALFCYLRVFKKPSKTVSTEKQPDST